MLLTVDVGNTTTGFGCFVGEEVVARFWIGTDRRRMAAEYQVLIKNLLDLNGMAVPDRVAIASVVPPVEREMASALWRSYGVEAQVLVGPNSGLDLAVDFPAEVGADRVANALGALEYRDSRERYLVVDFGTATTFDLVEFPNTYLGGAIAPGPQTALDALTLRTAKLPQVELKLPEHGAVGKNTVEQLQAGLVLGYAGLVEGMIARIKEVAGEALVIATGGFATTLAPICPALEVVDPDLTFLGLRVFAGEVG